MSVDRGSLVRLSFSLLLILTLLSCGTSAPKPVSITLTPTTLSLSVGATGSFSAVGVCQGEAPHVLLNPVWTSSTPAVATVSAIGLITAVSPGTTTITVSSQGAQGAGTVTVAAPTLASITLAPATAPIVLGRTLQLTLTGTMSDTTAAPPSALSGCTYASSAVAVATASTSGLVSTHAVGSATITATCGTLSKTSAITVTAAVLDHVTLAPISPSVALGLPQQFIAQCVRSDETTYTPTSPTWESSNTAVAAIDAAGRATTVAQGQTTITVHAEGMPASTTLTVVAPVIASIDVTPETPSIAVGATQQFTATATLTDATTQNVTSSVTWTSSDTNVATMDGATAGLAHGVANGHSTIAAALNSLTDSAALTVTTAAASLYALGTDSVTHTQALLSYSVSSDGTMAQTASTPASAATMVSDQVRFIYLDDASRTKITGYSINSSTGALTPLPVFNLTNGQVGHLVLDPSGTWLYGFDDMGETPLLRVFGINQATGALTDTGFTYALAKFGMPSGGGNSAAFLVNENGTFFYFGGSGSWSDPTSVRRLYGFKVDMTTGALAALTGSPFASSDSPYTFSMAVGGSTLYLALNGNRIVSYSLDPATGVPSEIGSWWNLAEMSPFQVITAWSGHIYAGQGAYLLRITPDEAGNLSLAATYYMPGMVRDLALDGQAKLLFGASEFGLSSFSLDDNGVPVLVTRITMENNGPFSLIVVPRPR